MFVCVLRCSYRLCGVELVFLSSVLRVFVFSVLVCVGVCVLCFCLCSGVGVCSWCLCLVCVGDCVIDLVTVGVTVCLMFLCS